MFITDSQCIPAIDSEVKTKTVYTEGIKRENVPYSSSFPHVNNSCRDLEKEKKKKPFLNEHRIRPHKSDFKILNDWS